MSSFFEDVYAERDKQRRERSVPGISIAMVTGRMGDGTYELNYLGMGNNVPSAPARMMMPNAGDKRGMYWMPEIGDEVIVAFEHGDSNAPIILGALFNSQSPAPEQAKPSNENNIRTLVSRTGHEVTFDDSPSAGKVTVRTKEGRSIVLDDTPPGKLSIETPMGISMVMDDATGTLTLKAPTAIVLESAALQLAVGGMSVAPGASAGTGTMSIDVPLAISIKSGVAISLNAAAIALTTVVPPGVVSASAVVIDGKPFGLHTHGVPPLTPPVTP